jgi:hypothetical protein
MGSKAFWLDAAERAVKTLAQTVVALVTAGQVVWDVDWTEALGVGATAAAISLLTSIASAGRSGTVSPASAVRED